MTHKWYKPRTGISSKKWNYYRKKHRKAENAVDAISSLWKNREHVFKPYIADEALEELFHDIKRKIAVIKDAFKWFSFSSTFNRGCNSLHKPLPHEWVAFLNILEDREYQEPLYPIEYLQEKLDELKLQTSVFYMQKMNFMHVKHHLWKLCKRINEYAVEAQEALIDMDMHRIKSYMSGLKRE